jgi:hypothetical protein
MWWEMISKGIEHELVVVRRTIASKGSTRLFAATQLG